MWTIILAAAGTAIVSDILFSIGNALVSTGIGYKLSKYAKNNKLSKAQKQWLKLKHS